MRKHLVWVIGLVGVIGVSAVSYAATTQTFDVSVSPSKAPKAKFAPTKVHVVNLAGSDVAGAGAVKPANRVQIFFDDDVKFDTQGVPTCAANKVTALDTAQARAACPKAIVGSGKSTAFVAGDPGVEIDGVITAFNGPKKGKNPTIILHSRFDAVATTTTITGVLTTQKGDFGNKLDVTIPPATGGSAVGLFDVTISKKTGQRQYVSVRCADKNKTLNYKGVFNYTGGEPSKTLLDKQKCSVRN